MKLRAYAAVLIGFAALAATAIPVEPSGLVLENDQVKVVRALEKAHVKGKFHQHKMNRVMIYLQPGVQRFEYQDGRKADTFTWKQGEVKWSPADGMHSPEVTSNGNFNIIEVELKTAGTAKKIEARLDPLKVDPKHYKLEFENDQVRVLRVRIEPHAKTPMHQHVTNRVTVFLTDQNFRTKDSQGTVSFVKHKAGEAVWGTPLTHTEENLSDKPFEVVTVEIKG